MTTPRLRSALLAPAILVAGILAMSACGSTATPADPGAESPATATELRGTAWDLESYAGVDGEPVAGLTSGEMGTLAFAADGSFAGSTGCNRIAGTYTQDGASLTLASGPMTLKACEGPVAAQEAAIVAALPLVASFTAGTSLVLQDADGTTLLTYAPGMSSLAGTSWQATGINNGKEAVVSQEGTEKVTAMFGDDGTVSGSGGCNTYSGTYTTSGADQITIGTLAATEMACPEPAMEIEQMYFAALGTVATYQIEGTTLTLRDAAGATQASFTLVP
jgi:heat shock protein HslJ